MSQVNRKIASLFFAKQHGAAGNTTVTKDGLVLLHGNPIARRNKKGQIQVCNGGYVSNTTVTRLKAIADTFDWPFTFRSRKGEMYAHLRGDTSVEFFIGSGWTSVGNILKKLGIQ